MAKSKYEYVKEWRARPENKSKRAEEARRWRIKHPDLWKEIQDRHSAGNADGIRVRDAERKRKRRVQDPEGEKRRRAAFKERSRAQQEAIAGRARPSVCEICSTDRDSIVFDHCHRTGSFRGWLCDRCNKMLGLVRDDAELLNKLAEYLRRHGSAPLDDKTEKRATKQRVRDPRQEGLPLE